MVERGVRILVRFGSGVFVWVLMRCESGVCFVCLVLGLGSGSVLGLGSGSGSGLGLRMGF